MDIVQVHRVDLRQLATIHGNLIAGVETRALYAVLVYLVRQDFAAGEGESKLPKELRYAREQANTGDPVELGLVQ
jgi:hypothetical protein